MRYEDFDSVRKDIRELKTRISKMGDAILAVDNEPEFVTSPSGREVSRKERIEHLEDAQYALLKHLSNLEWILRANGM